MRIESLRRGYAFAIVRPRGDLNFEAHSIPIVFAIDEGPRTYIEHINVPANRRPRQHQWYRSRRRCRPRRPCKRG
jgi:outer membrane protein insertion porin family